MPLGKVGREGQVVAEDEGRVLPYPADARVVRRISFIIQQIAGNCKFSVGELLELFKSFDIGAEDKLRAAVGYLELSQRRIEGFGGTFR